MKISIITVCYNSSASIQATLESVKNQNYKDIEHIIIDGNSTDNTLEICDRFPHISKIVSEPDKGIYDAYNKGLRMVRGQVVGFINADDIFNYEHAVSTIVEAFETTFDCVFGNLDYINDHGKVLRKWRSGPYKKGAFQKGWMPAHPSFYCRTSVYEKLGFYDDSFKIAGDFELMLRFLERHNIRSKFIPHTLVNMKVGGASNNSIKSKIKILQEEFRAFKQNDISVNKLSYIYNKAKKIKEFRF